MIADRPYSVGELAGLRSSHRNRRTGTIVSVYNGIEAEMCEHGDEEPWLVVCETHNSVLSMPTHKLARYHAAVPDGFCEACRPTHPTASTESEA